MMIYTLNVEIKSYFDDLFYQQIYENNCNISNYFGGTLGLSESLYYINLIN